MTAHEVLQRFRELETRIAEEKGGFTLFALFMREEAPHWWDLIVSAPWVTDSYDAVDYFVDQIKSHLSAQDLTNLSRIVVADPEHADVQALNRAVQVEHGAVEMRDSSFSGVAVKHGFIITSKRHPTPAAA